MALSSADNDDGHFLVGDQCAGVNFVDTADGYGPDVSAPFSNDEWSEEILLGRSQGCVCAAAGASADVIAQEPSP